MTINMRVKATPDLLRGSQPALFYERADGWMPLPGWGQFFLDLGASLARETSSEHRLVLGLAVPTRAFAAPLLGVGLTIVSARIPSTPAQIEGHFERLSALPLGTPLVYRWNGKQRLRAVFDGRADEPSSSRIRVKVEAGQGGNCHLLDAKLAQYVQIAEGKSPNLPKQQRGVSLAHVSEFVANVVGNDSVATFSSVSRLDCLLVGAAARIHTEVVETRLAVERAPSLSHDLPRVPASSLVSHDLTIGHLQSLLRARRFLPSGETYRSDVLPSHSRVPADQSGDVPQFVIFDGAASFLNCRERWRRSHWIVVLDKTEREFVEALSAFNQDFVKFRSDTHTQRSLEVSRTPASIDLAVYEEVWP